MRPRPAGDSVGDLRLDRLGLDGVDVAIKGLLGALDVDVFGEFRDIGEQ